AIERVVPERAPPQRLADQRVRLQIEPQPAVLARDLRRPKAQLAPLGARLAQGGLEREEALGEPLLDRQHRALHEPGDPRDQLLRLCRNREIHGRAEWHARLDSPIPPAPCLSTPRPPSKPARSIRSGRWREWERSPG